MRMAWNMVMFFYDFKVTNMTVRGQLSLSTLSNP